MKPSELIKDIVSLYKQNVLEPILIEASPGVGKTEIASQIATQLGIEFQCIHAPLMQPEDYGFPVISANKDNVEFIVSKSKFPVEGSNFGDKGILLIDELSQADASGQKILANLIQAREIHGQKLKSNWLIIATGNRQKDRAGANRLLSHLRNRLECLSFDVSLDDWVNWAMENQIKPEIISFLRFRPNLLNAFDPQTDINATPRAWAQRVNNFLGTVDKSREFYWFKGAVGEGAAAEFCAYLKIFRNLPDLDRVVTEPMKVKVPNDSQTQYAIVGALAHKTDAKNFGQVLKYILRMPPEFSVLYIRDSVRRCPEIQDTKEFSDWAMNSGADLLIN